MERLLYLGKWESLSAAELKMRRGKKGAEESNFFLAGDSGESVGRGAMVQSRRSFGAEWSVHSAEGG
jgi:hypothetical protein